jgi:hypothetical protein
MQVVQFVLLERVYVAWRPVYVIRGKHAPVINGGHSAVARLRDPSD